MRISLIILWCILLLTPGKSYGQDPYNFKFKTYTYNDGLVHNYTKKCLQDSKGFLWIITQHGLSRFDGVNFKNFEHIPSDSNSLPYDDLEDIAIDAKDRIWLSYKKGLCYYDQNLHRFIKIYSGDKIFESHAIVFDKKRNCIWSVNTKNYTKISCSNLQLQEINYRQTENPSDYIGKLLLDSKDRLWIPYIRANYRCIDLKTSDEFLYRQPIESMSFYEDDKNTIWMCTWQDGLRKITINDTTHIHEKFGNPNITIDNEFNFISTNIASSKLLGGNNILWISLNVDGLLLFDKTAKKMIRYLQYDANNKNGITSNFNEWIFKDKDENIWLCTWHGITKVNAREQQFNSWELPELKSELYNCVSGIVNDPFEKDAYWMSVVGSGIFKFSKKTKQITERYFYYYNSSTKSFKGKDYNYNWRWTADLFQDSHQQIWSSSYAGLIKIKNGQPLQVKLTDESGNILYPQASKEMGGFIWVMGIRGILKVNPLNDQYIFYEDSIDLKNCFYDAEMLDSNRLVLASDAGVKIFDIKNEQFTSIAPSLKKVMNIEIIGTKIYIGGLNEFAVYDLNSGATNILGKELGIHKVLNNRLRKDAQNNLWIFTSHGLFKYYTNKRSFEKFTPGDGIYVLSDDFIVFFSYQDKFHIGYRMAVTSFDPLLVNVNTKKVDPVIVEMYVNNQLMPFPLDSFVTNNLHLNHNENAIRINYTAPDFTNADKIIFSYQLEGFDTAWINAGSRRSIAYTNLPPGKYTFRLKSANSSGVWNEKISSISFVIETPFWQTWWFRFAVVALVAGLIYFLYRYRLKQIKKIYEVRSSISRSLHDEVGATLSSINIYSDVARNKTNEPAVQQLIDKVYEASANAMESMSDIVWYVNPKNDLLENLLIRMREYALPLLEAKGINVIFEAKENLEDLKTSMQQRHHLYLIFKEAINNTLKYADAKNILIQIAKDGSKLKMNIKDDGKGFDSNNNFRGNGLNNMYSRAADINADLIITSTPGHGTQISLSLIIT